MYVGDYDKPKLSKHQCSENQASPVQKRRERRRVMQVLASLTKFQGAVFITNPMGTLAVGFGEVENQSLTSFTS